MPRVTNLQNLAAGVPAEDDRLLLGFGMPAVTGLHTATGILPGPVGYVGEVTLLSATSIQCNPFRAMIAGTQSNVQGDYRVVNDAVLTRAIAPQDPTLGRIDLLVTYVRDTAYVPNEGVDDVRYAYVLPGTPAAAPVAPALPPNALLHGTITVPAGAGTVTFTPANTRPSLRQAGRDWGSFTGNLPSTDGPQIAGDTAFSTVLNCRLIWTEVSGTFRWRQLTTAQVTPQYPDIRTYVVSVNNAGLTWPAANYRFPHDGFLFWDAGRLWAISGSGSIIYPIGGGQSASITAGFTAAAGWGTPSGFVRNLGNGMAYAYLQVLKTTAALVIPATGDITNVDIGSVPAGWEPSINVAAQSGAGGRVASGSLLTTGAFNLGAVAPGGDIALTNPISLACVYPLADATAS